MENHNLCIEAAKAMGCQISNIDGFDIMKARTNNTQHLVLGMLWQIVKGLIS
jgi:hypothetical protein